MTPLQRQWIGGVVAWLALLVFVCLHGVPAFNIIRTEEEPPAWLKADVVQGFATAVSGLICGVVAVAFGVPPPQATSRLEAAASRTSLAPSARLTIQQNLVLAYVLCFLLVSAVAVIALVKDPELVPKSTEALALFAAGTVVAIAREVVVP